MKEELTREVIEALDGGTLVPTGQLNTPWRVIRIKNYVTISDCTGSQIAETGGGDRGEFIANTIVECVNKNEALTGAMRNLLHLHTCEQEGIESGMPTPEQWEQAVDNAVIALKGARSES